jgi:hypothetical protein
LDVGKNQLNPGGGESPVALRLVAALVVIATISAVYVGVSSHHDRHEGAAETTPTPVGTAAVVVERVADAKYDDPATDVPPVTRQSGSAPEPLQFIRTLAKRAFDGDAEAQYLVAREFDRCGATLSLVRKLGDPEPAFWRATATWSQGLREWTLREFQRCSPLLKGDPFVDLPPRDGGYPASYWFERARESAHPVAVVEHEVFRMRGIRSEQGLTSDAERAEARDKIVAALMSGDPDASLALGHSLLAAAEDDLRTAGVAWMLVGCHAGGDCGENSAIVPVAMCVGSGDCPAGMNVESYIGAQLGPAAYARAYALFEELERDLRGGNVAALKAQLDY